MPTTRLAWLAEATPEQRRKLVKLFDKRELAEFEFHWKQWARAAQLPPPGDWRFWLVLAGRGFGKTRAGAEWVRMIAERDPTARIALVSSSLAEARSVMVEGESGILACSPTDRLPRFEATLRRLSFSSPLRLRPLKTAPGHSARSSISAPAMRLVLTRLPMPS